MAPRTEKGSTSPRGFQRRRKCGRPAPSLCRLSFPGRKSDGCGGLNGPRPGHATGVSADAEADRIRSLVLLRAACETVLGRLDDSIDDLALTVQIGDLCTSLSAELDRFAHRNGR